MFSWSVCRVCFDPAGPFHLRMVGSHDRREGRSDCEAVVLESYSPMESNPSPKKRLAMTSLRIVCGLEELAMHSRSGLTNVLSILDPHYPKPEVFSGFDEHAKLELRFHDAIEPAKGVRLPREKDVAAILEFGERLHAEPNQGQRVVLVHCHAGISRSTAAMAMLIAQAHPELDEKGRLRTPDRDQTASLAQFADGWVCRRSSASKRPADRGAGRLVQGTDPAHPGDRGIHARQWAAPRIRNGRSDPTEC